MKLYEVPRNTRVALSLPLCRPTGDVEVETGFQFNFSHVDGMFSYCTTDEGYVFHPSASTEVDIV